MLPLLENMVSAHRVQPKPWHQLQGLDQLRSAAAQEPVAIALNCLHSEVTQQECASRLVRALQYIQI
jgi:hypothetical protein